MNPWRRGSRWLVLCSVALLAGFAPAARAQGIESVLSPGKLIQGHAEWEDACARCHVRFDRGAQDRLCMDCHKDVSRDMAGKTGLHGRLKPQPCRGCHTDHKGRGARIVALDTKQFDHGLTNYPLRGAHQKTECTKCHLPASKYRDTTKECNACHRKDDVHKGSLGAQCADCHSENNWKQARFAHTRTRFALSGKHADTACADCHKSSQYKDTPRACVACHRKDDERNGHKGRFGDKCESCHTTRQWTASPFNHDTDTRYVLRGRHRTARCTDCHTGPLYKTPLTQACYDCHKKDDRHKETLGRECASCHTERDWKEKARFDHDKTGFPLLGKHTTAECKSCHKSSLFKEAPKDCHACHKKDDKHQATLGEKCADCHQERGWKATAGRFDHERTRFALRNAHADPGLECKACHRDLRSFRPTPLDCYSCHQKDDRHAGQQGRQCEQCHNDRDWKTTRFDHARARFALLGRHLAVECKACHETQRFKDTPRDCQSCHMKDDRHALKFGLRCDGCHSARGWAAWDYDHDKRSSFRLDGAHRKLACEGCHRGAAPAGKPIADVGSSCLACHRKDDTHDGGFGARCEQCHSTEHWKRIRNRVGSMHQTGTGGAS